MFSCLEGCSISARRAASSLVSVGWVSFFLLFDIAGSLSILVWWLMALVLVADVLSFCALVGKGGLADVFGNVSRISVVEMMSLFSR